MDLEHMTRERSDSELFLEYRTALTRFATALVGPSDAPDAVSEAFLSLLRSGRLRDAQKPVALMYRAVSAKSRSMQRSWYRRRRREQRFAERLIAVDPELRPDVVDAVIELSPRQRACVYLTYWEDLSPAVVAGRLGIGEGTVKRYLARARARLREVLDE